jgi:hypothetical protein
MATLHNTAALMWRATLLVAADNPEANLKGLTKGTVTTEAS